MAAYQPWNDYLVGYGHMAAGVGISVYLASVMHWINVNAVSVYLKITGTGDGNTPLHTAVEMRQWNTVKKLIENGYSTSMKNRDGECPLHMVYSHYKEPLAGEEVQVVMRLLVDGGDINTQDQFGFSILHTALCHEDWSLVEKLIQNGADVNLTILNQCPEMLPISLLELVEMKLHVPLKIAMDITNEMTLKKSLKTAINIAQHAMEDFQSGLEYLKYALKFLRPCEIHVYGVYMDINCDNEYTVFMTLLLNGASVQVDGLQTTFSYSYILMQAGCSRPSKLKSSRMLENSHCETNHIVSLWKSYAFQPSTLFQLCVKSIRNSMEALPDGFSSLPLPRKLLEFVQLNHMKNLIIDEHPISDC